MLTLQDSADLEKGEAICARLKAMGLNPVWLEAKADKIAIGFEFISATPKWTKAFYLDAPLATPGAFVQAVNHWRNEVRRAIYQKEPSAVVKDAIAVHGMLAVLDAMEDSALVH